MHSRRFRWSFPFAFALVANALAFHASGAPAVQMRSGEIEGAKFSIARTVEWNRNLLLLAHGLRPLEAPLTADAQVDDPAYARLLADGWMIASTSYRRNGMIVRDAIADVNALRDHIERTDGAPSLVLLLGASMGGAIVTLMAENEPGRYHGAVAIGAALHARDPVYPLALTHAPKIPILFLTNQSELDGPSRYAQMAAEAPVAPALWIVSRDGHVNVNHKERTLALEGLITWITANQIERRRDATVQIASDPGDVSFSGDSARGTVASITDGHGNLFTTFRPEDVARLGIAKGDDFELVAGGQKFLVRYGSDYGDVPRGAWIAFDRAEGVLLIARNFANAAKAAGVSAGDPLTIRPVPEE